MAAEPGRPRSTTRVNEVRTQVRRRRVGTRALVERLQDASAVAADLIDNDIVVYPRGTAGGAGNLTTVDIDDTAAHAARRLTT